MKILTGLTFLLKLVLVSAVIGFGFGFYLAGKVGRNAAGLSPATHSSICSTATRPPGTTSRTPRPPVRRPAARGLYDERARGS